LAEKINLGGKGIYHTIFALLRTKEKNTGGGKDPISNREPTRKNDLAPEEVSRNGLLKIKRKGEAEGGLACVTLKHPR